MKRLFIPFLVLLLLLCRAALAETPVYPGGADVPGALYHATPLCLYADGATNAIAPDEARARGLSPCPVCVDGLSDPQGVRAVARGGTLILRVTDAWMAARPDISTGEGETLTASGIHAMTLLADTLHGETYAAFLQAIARDGQAGPAAAYTPDADAGDGSRVLCRRHVGGAWVLALRPGEAAQARMAQNAALRVNLSFTGGAVTYADGALSVARNQAWRQADHLLKLDKLGAEPIFLRSLGNLDLSLFHEMDADILVLHERGADPALCADALLALDGFDEGIPLTGYMAGADAVYVGILTAPEAAALPAGADFALEHPGGESPSEALAYAEPGGRVWHAWARCGGGNLPVALSTEGMLPCPVCVQDDRDYGAPRGVERGGTLVLRMGDAWMANQETSGVFAGISTDETTGDAARRVLAEAIHGDAYVEAARALDGGGTWEGRAYVPGIYPENDELTLCQRHIGGAWYTVLRPAAPSIYLRFFCGPLHVEGGAVRVAYGEEHGEDPYALPMEKLGGKAVFQRDGDALGLALFREMDANILVLHEHHADRDLLEEVSFTLDGQPLDVPLTGYMAGSDAVYVAVLSDPEAEALQGGAEPALTRRPWITEEAYQGTDYAIVTKGTAGAGVVDRRGEFVIPPIGDDGLICRTGDTFFLEGRGLGNVLRAVRVADGQPEELMSLKAPANGNVSWNGANGAVFTVSFMDFDSAESSWWGIYDLATGDRLGALPLEDPDGLTWDSLFGVNPRYPLESAPPQRVVVDRGLNDLGDNFWLADNQGRRASGNFHYIEPLAWSAAGGLFLVSDWQPWEHTDFPNDAQDFLAGYDGRPWFGEHWRCGVIDQDGKVLAPMAYVKATLLDAQTVRLEDPDGQTVEVRLTP